ncbi:MAG: class I SAM-dependent methyltransferase [Acidobacteriaceae bacterium]|nr:class I SAM-dependent methyltransferase [Acidobacteriaceae bacterium]
MHSLSADAITYHRGLACDWEGRYRKHAFRARETVLAKCLEGRNLTGALWLDAGCGSGTLSRWLAARGCRVVGMDAAPEMVRAAHNNAICSDSSTRAQFACIGTIAKLPLPDGCADGILCSSVLEYVSDPCACVQEFARVLKRGGQLLVSVPNRKSVVRRVQVECQRWGSLVGIDWMKFVKYSRQEFSRAEFQKLLMRTGFSVRKELSLGSPLPALAQRSRLWGPLVMFAAEKI